MHRIVTRPHQGCRGVAAALPPGIQSLLGAWAHSLGPLSSRPVPFTTVSVLKEMLLSTTEPNFSVLVPKDRVLFLMKEVVGIEKKVEN